MWEPGFDNIPVWVMEPLKGGRLVHLSREAEDILRAAAPGQSIPSWSFRYLMGLDNVQCVLSGMSSPQEIHANAEVFREGNTLSPADRHSRCHETVCGAALI